MTDDQKVGNAPAEGAADANQPVSQEGAKPIEGDAIKLLTEFGDKLTGLERELRGLQGRQDKTTSTVNDFQARLAEYEKLREKMSPEEAMNELNRVDSETEWRTNITKQLETLAGRLGGIGTTPSEQQMVAEVLSEFGLDLKDPYVASQMQGKRFGNKLEAEAFAGRLLRDKTKAPVPDESQTSSSPGAAIAAADVYDLYRRYEEAAKHPTRNAELLKTLEEQMKAAG